MLPLGRSSGLLLRMYARLDEGLPGTGTTIPQDAPNKDVNAQTGSKALGLTLARAFVTQHLELRRCVQNATAHPVLTTSVACSLHHSVTATEAEGAGIVLGARLR
jgi:hypothetical protein